MRFGPVAVAEAAGAILAHTTRAGDRVLKKGRVLSAEDAAALAAAGLREVIAARLDPDELAEDAAAAAVAASLAGAGLSVAPAHTGRANVHAAAAGVVLLDPAAIAAANAADEAITLATALPYAAVRAG
ncbi:MAG TPA: 4-diphosphocytidyl-2C-methyl-D-erythritol kinase, partial [Kofleriaceae bacterium]|nr:4-diphosphocytidyl-2C-methyl-D-erythritol kinase [Kofleriaceae bacterium]